MKLRAKDRLESALMAIIRTTHTISTYLSTLPLYLLPPLPNRLSLCLGLWVWSRQRIGNGREKAWAGQRIDSRREESPAQGSLTARIRHREIVRNNIERRVLGVEDKRR